MKILPAIFVFLFLFQVSKEQKAIKETLASPELKGIKETKEVSVKTEPKEIRGTKVKWAKWG